MSDFVSCIGCGHQLHVTAPACPKCGAPQPSRPASQAASTAAPTTAPTTAHPAAAIPLAGGAPKPATLVKAEKLLWATVAMGVVHALLVLPKYSSAGLPVEVTASITVLTLALVAFLFFKISKGKNWARISYLVLFLVGIPQTLSMLSTEFDLSFLAGLLTIAGIGLQGYALYLLFTRPGSGWFAPRRP